MRPLNVTCSYGTFQTKGSQESKVLKQYAVGQFKIPSLGSVRRDAVELV
jgi:hypothetical protein